MMNTRSESLVNLCVPEKLVAAPFLSRIGSAAIFVLLLLSAATSAVAQTARFSGQVTDQQNAAVPGANVEVTNLDTKSTLTAQTDSSGQFTVPYLPAGQYQIKVTAEGFTANVRGPIRLGVGQSFTYNVQLSISQQETNVSVQANAVTDVQTENAEVAGTITGKEVTSLQLNGRNFTQFIALVPGVSNQTQQDEAKVGQAGSVAYSVNGGRTEYNSFLVDGSETLNVGINKDHSTLIVYPSIDAIQEIKVLTSNYGAMYPSTGNGTTIVTTRSGTDRLHGNLYEFLRNELFNAKGYFDVTNGAPLYRRHDFGGTIGGPIVIPKLYNGRGKTHFFFSQEVRLEKTPTAYRQAVPSAAERNGDFNDVCPAFGSVQTLNRTAYPDCPLQPGGSGEFFPNNQLNYIQNGGSLNNNAVALLNTGVIPFPTATSGCNSTTGSCYNVDVSLPTYWREELFRIDHTISSKLQASFRYIHDEWDETTPIPPYTFLTNSFPTIQSRYYAPGISLVARLTATPSPSLLNEFVASYTNSRVKLTNVPASGVTLQYPSELNAPCSFDSVGNLQCGMSRIFNTGSTKLPGISIAGNNAVYGGVGFNIDPAYIPWEHTNPTYSFNDTVTKIIDRHNLQFGAQWIIYQRNQDNTPIGAATGDTQGILNFSNVQGNNFGSTGNAFADFLYLKYNPPQDGSTPGVSDVVGAIASYQQDSGQARYRQRYQIVEPFFQDDFKVNSHLTVNAGLRLSLFGTYHTVDDNIYNWDPAKYSKTTASSLIVDSATGELVDVATGNPLPLNPNNPQADLDPRVLNGLVQCGKNAVPSSCMSGHLFNLAPRVGFAWDPWGNGRTALRAGYGIFFEHGTGDEANAGSLEASAPGVLNMTALSPTGWGTIGRNVAYPLNVTAIPKKAVWPYVQQWSVSVERELPYNTLLTTAYVGSRGNHLTAERQINQLPPLAASANPFGPHEPIIRTGYNPATGATQGGDCGYGINGGVNGAVNGYALLNGTTISGTPAALNFEAACYGTPGSQARNPNALRTFAPTLGQIFSLENIAFSDYHAFQTTLRKTQGPLTLGVSYTYSHSLDDASDRSDATFVNSANIRSNYANSNFDQRHLLHISYIYNLPLLSFWQHFLSTINKNPDTTLHDPSDRPPSAFATSNFAHYMLNGWELSGITLFETGIPFTIVNNGSPSGISVLDNAGVANGVGSGSYPDLVGDPHGKRPREGDNAKSVGPLLRNPGAYAAPRGLTFGTAGRNSLNNPRRWNFDVSTQKRFPLHEGVDLEFRAEAFNVFNHTQFRIYNPTLGNQAQNTLSCYGGPLVNYSAAGGDGTDCLTGSSFLHPVDAHRPRTMQFALKLAF
jgi:hypothetical protein